MGGLSVVAHERSRKRQGDLLPQVILEMSLSLQLSCLTDGVQSSTVTVIQAGRHGNLYLDRCAKCQPFVPSTDRSRRVRGQTA